MRVVKRGYEMSRVTNSQQRARRHSVKLFRFALGLWGITGFVALLTPWAYGMVAVAFAAFLHLAALDGDSEDRELAQRRR